MWFSARVSPNRWRLCAAALAVATIAPAAVARDKPASRVDDSTLEAQLAALPRLPANQRKVATIYQFRSGVPGITNLALTDMFMTALVKSGTFLVAEREQLVPDIQVEKQLQQSGAATGTAGSTQLAGAQLIFTGAVSEQNANAGASDGGVTIGGMSVGGSSQKMQVAIDVRILDAGTGLVMDTVTVTRDVKASSTRVSGVGSLANGISGLSGGPAIPLSPDVNVTSSSGQGVDAALRACIYQAVLEIAKRYGAQAAAGGQ